MKHITIQQTRSQIAVFVIDLDGQVWWGVTTVPPTEKPDWTSQLSGQSINQSTAPQHASVTQGTSGAHDVNW